MYDHLPSQSILNLNNLVVIFLLFYFRRVQMMNISDSIYLDIRHFLRNNPI